MNQRRKQRLQERDDAIRAGYDDGSTQAELAIEYNLSQKQISNICRGVRYTPQAKDKPWVGNHYNPETLLRTT